MILQSTEYLNGPTASREYSGVVVDNRDPLGAGRVRALVEGRLEVPASQYSRLPWLEMDRPPGSGREDTASVRILPLRSEITVRFIDDSPYMGRYSGGSPSSEYSNSVLVDNYPHTQLEMDTDGAFTRKDPEQGYREQYNPDGSYDRTDQAGRVITVPSDLLVHIDGRLRLRVGGLDLSVEDALNLVSDTLTASADAINMRALGVFNTDGSIRNDQNGVTNSVPATAAAAAVEARIERMQERVTDLDRKVKAVQEAGQTFNEGVVRNGVTGVNSEPSTGIRDNRIKRVAGAGRGINLRALLQGGSLIDRVLGAIPELRNTVDQVQRATDVKAQLRTYEAQVAGYREALYSYTPSRIAAVESSIRQLDALLGSVANATGVSTASAIRGSRPAIESQMTSINADIAALERVQAAHEELPVIADEAARLSADAQYDNLATQEQVVSEATTVTTVDISRQLESLQARRDTLQEIVSASLAYEELDREIGTVSTSSDPLVVKTALNRMRALDARTGDEQ